jgi:hypothetical protein
MLRVVIASCAFACTPKGSTPNTTTSTNPFRIKLADVTQDSLGVLLRSGLNAEHIGVGNGAALGDLDGDNLPDIVFARVDNPMDPIQDASGPSMLFQNTSPSAGVLSFQSVDAFSSFAKGMVAFGVALGDYDNDGDLDIFLVGRGKDHLFQNQGNMVFKDVTDKAGVGGPDNDVSTSPVFADVNNDGLLDIYLTEYGNAMEMPTGDLLYLNLGDGTFVEVSQAAGVNDPGAGHTAAIGDLDGDNFLDIWVANDTLSVNKRPGPAQLPPDSLFVGQGPDDKGVPQFQDHGGDRGIHANRASMGIGIADFDNDGNLDVVVTDNGPTDLYLWRPDQMAYEEASGMMKCALGVETDDTGHQEVLVHWGALPLDFDRDGALELYYGAGSLTIRNPNAMEPYYQLDAYIRQEKSGQVFDDITGAVGLDNKVKIGDANVPLGHRGVFFADFDIDGNDDLVVGAYDAPFRIYQNRTPINGNHWVRLRLKGTVSAPDPVGAIVTVQTSDNKTLTKQRIAGGHTYGNSDYVTEIALGTAMASTVTVKWPSGLVQSVDTLSKFTMDGEFEVDEPQWLQLSSRVIPQGGQGPVLTIKPFDEMGVLLDSATAAGKHVTVTRSDKQKVTVSSSNGVFKATIDRPTVARRLTLSINIDGTDLPIHPMITFR